MAIEFTCPLCGKQTVVADQFAGQTGPCANCGGQITIPMKGFGPAGPTSAPKSGGGSVAFVVLAVIAGCLLLCCGGGVAVVLLGRSQVRITQQRIMSQNNLKQIGLALHNYHSVHGMFPPAVVTDADGKPLYSGRVLLLPFLEQQPLYDSFDKSKAWDSPENASLSSASLSVFQDPANKDGPPQRSDYVFVTGPGTMFEGKKPIRLHEVTDGLSNTVMVIGTSGGPANWAAPVDWSIESGTAPRGFQPDKLLVLYGDGSVRVMKPEYFQQNMSALTSRSGGEILPPER